MMMRKLFTALALLLVFTAGAQVTTIDPARLLQASSSANRLLITNASSATTWSDANIEWDASGLEFRIAQPPGGGTARIQAQGSSSDATSYILQGYNSGASETSRITSDGYFQGTGVAVVGATYTGTFNLNARIYQPTSVTSTITSGGASNFRLSAGFAPTSGNGVYSMLEIDGTVNQTGGANGKVNGLLIHNNLTSAPNYWALETGNSKSIFGNESIYPEVPARLNVVGLGNTSSTTAFDAYNTSGTLLFRVRDDGNIGIKNGTPAYTLDCSAATDGIRLPVGTTANRPTGAAGVMRMNTDADIIEWYDGTDWQSIGAGGGSGAPTGAQYVTLASDGTLSAERVLTAGSNIKLTDGGANTTITVAALAEQFVQGGIISPSQLTANQNDWSPTGLSTASVIRLSTDGTFRIITGLAGGADGRRVTLVNVGSYTVMLRAESASSSASNRFAFDNTDRFILPGRGIELLYDGTLSRWIALTPFDYDTDYVLSAQFRHGVAGTTGSGTNGDFFVKANTGGSGSGNGGSPWGSSGITTSSSATGKGSIGTPANAMVRSVSTTYLRYQSFFGLSAASDGTNTYYARCGWMSSANPTGEPGDGVYFRYTHGTNSGNWQFVARKSSTETVINTSTAPVTNSTGATGQSLIVVVAPNGAECEGFINGVSVGVTTTNVPNTTNMGVYTQIEKTAGTTSRTLYMIGASLLVVNNQRQ